MHYPKITIVTPSYGQGDYIEETILSILDQGYPNLEYMVIDGGSQDQTVDVIRKYERHLTYWLSEKDRGQSHAINKGFHRATGDIINWINSDDTLAPGALKRIAEVFATSGPEIGLIHGGTRLFDAQGDLRNDFGYDDPSLERFLSGMAFSQPSAFYRRSYLEQVGHLDEQLHYGMDFDLFSRLALVCKFRKVPDVLSGYRLHPVSKTVADDHRFIGDWTLTFFRLLATFGFSEVESQVRSLGVEPPREAQAFAVAFDRSGRRPDPELMQFYFLCYVVRSDYRSGNLHRARRIVRFLAARDPDRLERESDLDLIVRRLRWLPNEAIRVLRLLRPAKR